MADDAPPSPWRPLSRVHPVVWVLIALGVPTVLHLLSDFQSAREFKLEQAALQQLLTIQSAQTRYFSQFGRFATTLQELGPGLISGDLAKGVKTGYQFTLIGGPTGYTINANPVNFGTTGRRTFFSDQSKVVRENWGAQPATINSPPERGY
jgi:type II secretory pathway pseudopilin PulG